MKEKLVCMKIQENMEKLYALFFFLILSISACNSSKPQILRSSDFIAANSDPRPPEA